MINNEIILNPCSLADNISIITENLGWQKEKFLNEGISVILPFRTNLFLVDAVESVFASRFPSAWELLLIANQADDKSIEVVSSLLKKNVKLIFANDKLGLSYALNIGLANSRYDFVARMDSDDLCLAGRMLEQFNFLKENRETKVVGGQSIVIDQYGKEIDRTNFPTQISEINRKLERRNVISHPTVMFDRKCIESLGGYDESLESAQDYDLWMRVKKSFGISNLKVPVIKYRIHANSLGSKKKTQQRMNAIRVKARWSKQYQLLRTLGLNEKMIVFLGNYADTRYGMFAHGLRSRIARIQGIAVH